eukprot:267525_1
MHWLLLVIQIILYGLLIWWWGHKSTYHGSLSFWEVYLFKILGFFYQITPSINELFEDPVTEDWSSWIEYIFNFYFPVDENMALLSSSIVFIMCFILFAIFFWIDRSDIKMNFYFTPTFITFCIYVYPTVVRMSFQLLGYAKLTLWPGWYVLAMLELIVVCMCPFGLWYSRKMSKMSRWWHLLTIGYKRRAWWYEPYKIFCKLLVIVFSSISVDKQFKIVLIRSALFGFLMTDIWVLPFSKKYKHDSAFDINKIEITCLIILCLLSMLVDYERDTNRNVYTILKFIPTPMIMVLVLYGAYNQKYKIKSSDEKHNISPHKIQQILQKEILEEILANETREQRTDNRKRQEKFMLLMHPEMVDIQPPYVEHQNNVQCYPYPEGCNYTKRALVTLKHFQSLNISDSRQQNIFLQSSSISLLDDYIHILTHHNQENELKNVFDYMMKNGFNECDIRNCSLFRRHVRNRSEVNYAYEMA